MCILTKNVVGEFTVIFTTYTIGSALSVPLHQLVAVKDDRERTVVQKLCTSAMLSHFRHCSTIYSYSSFAISGEPALVKEGR